MKKLIQLVSLLFIFAACQVETPAPANVEPVNPNLSTKRMGPQAKAMVFRFNGASLYVFPVPEKNITLVLGANIKELCLGDPNVDVFSLHQVFKPDGDPIPRIHDLAKGQNVLLQIWPFSDFNSDCQPFLPSTPTYSGRVDVIAVDNDLVPFDQSNNINSFGFNAKGNDISVVYRGAWDGLDFNTWTTRVCNIRFL